MAAVTASRTRVDPEIAVVVLNVYPLIQARHVAPREMLGFAHAALRDFAERTERGIDWADMALRVMLEFDRPEASLPGRLWQSVR